jgi:spore maturation protein CgeB
MSIKLVIFGLTLSSSWGNGHATILRGLCRALAAEGHRITFFERDVPYYAAHRDLLELPGCDLRLYGSWGEVLPLVAEELSGADVAMITSYCPDGIAATELLLCSGVGLKCFYDLDTAVTLERVAAGERVEYIGPRKLEDFDIVLSFVGGQALEGLRSRLGARRVAPLYGCVDPSVHAPLGRGDMPPADLSYLGTYAADRQTALDVLFLETARRLPDRRFVLAGALYPADFPWRANISYLPHVAPGAHAAFYCASSLTLNITRCSMARMGYCPSGRLFEAAACGVPILSDAWEGMQQFFEPQDEILVATSTEEVIEALSLPPSKLEAIARAARDRVLAEHTAVHRARQLLAMLECAANSSWR